jgi:surfactin synthase thioesterase subunit
MAPAPTVRGFNTDSLAEITVPTYIQTGAADQECPVESCTNWLGTQNPSFQIEILDGDVGHYVFLSEPTKYAIEDVPEISIDTAGIDRRTIHQHAADTADRFFSATE